LVVRVGDRGGECAGEDGVVSADRARDVDDDLVRLALTAVLAHHQLAGLVGVRVEPGHCEIGPLVDDLCAGGGFVAAGRAGPRRPWPHR